MTDTSDGSEVDSKLILACREQHDVAGKVQSALSAMFAEFGNADHIYTFKHRQKPVNSIFLKVQRKRAEGRRDSDNIGLGYSPEHLTDAWGCRFVTLYQYHIPVVLRGLLEMVARYNEQHIDAPITFCEFVVYTSRPTGDTLSIDAEAMAIATKHSIDGTVIRAAEHRKSAYSSVHLVLSLPVSMTFPGYPARVVDGKFEVQIRDIFEEGWGEIQHHLVYGEKDQLGGEARDVTLEPLWRPHLHALKTFVDGCSQHASIIHRSYDFLKGRSIASLDNTSTSSQQSDLEVILTVIKDAAPEIRREIATAYDLLLGAQAIDGGPNEVVAYQEAAAKLEKAIAALGPLLDEPIPSRNNLPVRYFLVMEQANALAFSSTGPNEQALQLYSDVIERFPDDPVAQIRYSGALFRTGREDPEVISRCIAYGRRAIELAKQDKGLTGPSHWISLAAYVRVGFLEFSVSRLPETSEAEGHVALRRAVEATEQAYRFWLDLPDRFRVKETYRLYAHKAVSNILYYLSVLVSAGAGQKGSDEESIRHFLKVIEAIDVPQYKEYFKTRDNMMLANAAIGEDETARSLAETTVNELRRYADVRAKRHLYVDEVLDFLNQAEIDNYRSALEMLTSPKKAINR